jgi:hypothetical protein
MKNKNNETTRTYAVKENILSVESLSATPISVMLEIP